MPIISDGNNQTGDELTDKHTTIGTTEHTGSYVLSGSAGSVLNVKEGLLFVTSSDKVGIGTKTPSSPLHVYSNESSNFAALIDNDQSSAGHVMKLTTDGTGNGSYVLDMESASSTIFRARADGRFGFGPDGVSSMGAGTFVVGIDNSSHTSDIAISQRLQHLGDSDTYMDFPSNDNITFAAGGSEELKIASDAILVKQYIKHVGDENTWINFSDNRIRLNAGGNNFIDCEDPGSAPHKVRINNGGNNIDFVIKDNSNNVYFTADASTSRVGIGADAPPSTMLTLSGSEAYLTLQNKDDEHTDGGAETRINFNDHSGATLARVQGSHDGTSDDTRGDLIFSTNDGSSLNQAIKINRSGLVTVGPKTDPDTQLHVTNDSQSTISMMTYNDTTAGAGGMMRIGRSRGTSNSPAPLVPGDQIGSIVFAANSEDAGSEAFGFASMISVKCVQTGSSASGDKPAGSIRFFTTEEITGGANDFEDRMIIAHNGNVGIGTEIYDYNDVPSSMLTLSGSEAYLTLQNKDAEHTDGGAETRVNFNDHSGTTLARVQGSHDGTSDDTKGDLIFSTHDGTSLNEAMRINSNGNITVEKGLISSPSVLVNASDSPIVGQNWIKIARQDTDFSSGQTSQGIFLVTFVGREGVDDRGTKSTYIITVKFTSTVNPPYYLASGTHITADAIDSGDLDGFDPANDILITHEQDSTPSYEVWIRSRETHKHCYCTYLGGTNNIDNAAYSNLAPIIQVNQTSAASITSLGNEIYGTWVDKTFNSVSIGTGTSSSTSPLHIASTGLDALFNLTTTEAGASASPIIELKRDSTSPTAADYLGQLKLKGENDADEEVTYAKITGKIGDASNGSEDGIIEFSNIKAGSQTITTRLKSDSLQLLNGTNLSVNGVIQMDVQSGDPSTATDSAHIYAKDVGSSAEVFVQDEAGNVTQISPHNSEGEWQYFSRNIKTGKVVRINMEKMIKKLEQITGETFIEEWYE